MALVAVIGAAGCSSGNTTRPTGTPGSQPESHRSPGSSGAAPAPTKSLEWHACGIGECATLSVPLDYKLPLGRHLDLAVARGHRGQPGRRIGSLIVNPGGPGAAGRDLAEYVASVLPRAITDRFDIVGWDPRGSGASSPVRCGRDLDYLFDGDTAPDNAAERTSLEVNARRFVDACVRRSGDLLEHISTRDTVRDLDRLRAALGDPRLTYLGFSYGTYIGAMYASMFPSRVRALVLDGAVDPALSAEDVAVQQAKGFGGSLQTFFDWCANRTTCAFRHNGDPRAAYEALVRSIDTNPRGTGTNRVGPTQLDLAVGALLYGGEDQYTALADGLRDLERGTPATLRSVSDQYVGRGAGGRYDAEWAAFIAISCADGPNLTVGEMETLQQRAGVEAPDFGAGNVGLGYQCSYWPYPPDRSAPTSFSAPSAPPIAVVGTTGDPATPFAWSESLARQLGSGRLVAVTGSTHTASLNGNPCLEGILTRYFVDRDAPASGTRCGARTR